MLRRRSKPPKSLTLAYGGLQPQRYEVAHNYWPLYLNGGDVLLVQTTDGGTLFVTTKGLAWMRLEKVGPGA